ncbi:glycosyltransferase [Roseobacter sp. S98]|uniref:glycosyltransferase n=1 Tax=Roseobacter algicola (ex Choi et al. 2025) (nom. illeg.) TaxID=3092138 RepID=UPI003F512C2F
MACTARPIVLTLCYKDVTSDPRVMKEALALQANGFRVHVLCGWQEGKPKQENIDGLKVTRFEVFSSAEVSADDLELFPFLDRSKAAIADCFLPFAEASESLRSLSQDLDSRFGANAIKRMQSGHFRSAKGVERSRRFRDYCLLKLATFPNNLLSSLMPASPRRAGLPLGTALRQQKRALRRLYQTEAIILASNLTRADVELQASVIHAHDIYCLVAGVWLSRRLGVPLVYDAHEYEPGRSNNLSEFEKNLAGLIEDDCFEHVARMITVSKGIAELYGRRFGGPPPALVMNSPNIALEAIAEPDENRVSGTIRELAGLKENQPLIVFTGGIQRDSRGLDKVVQALTYLPGYQLVCLGPRTKRDDNWLLKHASRHGTVDRVTLLPPVKPCDVPRTISSADVSIIPFQDGPLNHKFAMPNKLFEAAFAGIPLCVSDLKEMRTFVETLGIGEAMDQTDPVDIAHNIRRVVENRRLYEMTREAKQLLVQKYSWEVQSNTLRKTFEDLLS